MTSQYSAEHNGRATDEHEGILEQIADLVVAWSKNSCGYY